MAGKEPAWEGKGGALVVVERLTAEVMRGSSRLPETMSSSDFGPELQLLANSYCPGLGPGMASSFPDAVLVTLERWEAEAR